MTDNLQLECRARFQYDEIKKEIDELKKEVGQDQLPEFKLQTED